MKSPNKTIEFQILEELDYSDMTTDALKKRLHEPVARILEDMSTRKLIEEYETQGGEIKWRKK